MTLQLEVGKKYLNRRDEVVEIVYDCGSHFTYRYEDIYGTRYADSGEYYKQEIHEEDLVSEYVEPSTKPAEVSTKAPHTHKDVIIAWANEAEVEFFDNGHWYDVTTPDWNHKTTYRIKPEKKVSTAQIWADDGGIFFTHENPNLILTFEDGNLIKAEVL